MSQNALKIGLVVVVLGLVIQDANAFGHCGGRGCGGYGYGGYGGWGYGGYSSPVVPSTVRPLVGSSQPVSSNSVQLTVSVPTDAKVFVNGLPTRSTGERRQYTSTGVQPSAIYPYQVRAEFVRDGKPVSEEKTVRLTAGQTGSLEFGTAPKAQAADMATSAPR